ncbi:hypothetical protein EPI10_000810 [Gossypium australe]|uniref:Uncharacterized protein n=1 Tax=Gossypium australe TaxID=47621 RepID=A0A5B6V9N6_9ROSI|nr:hypothetical protein EPI10_000810 [Gossypium australe]
MQVLDFETVDFFGVVYYIHNLDYENFTNISMIFKSLSSLLRDLILLGLIVVSFSFLSRMIGSHFCQP